MKRLILFTMMLSTITGGLFAQKKAKFFNLIPYPTELNQGKGEFVVNSRTIIKADEKSSVMANFLCEVLSTSLSTEITVQISSDLTIATNSIVFVWVDEKSLGPQGYRLEITSDNITIRANEANGFFMAIATIRQLLPLEGKKVSLPSLTILDKPEFTWRGMMLDVGRHYFPKEVIKRYIDLLSFYKFTELHWHLTDDQGWRIEIKKYPKLTEVGAWRTEANGSKYGGFYKQEEIREIVAYAQSRGITIVPEIEMPGHSMASLAAYPELSCTGGPFTVPNGWGVFEDVYCAGKESTFTFLENVLTEVLDLFPSTFIHIGGDE